MANSLTVAQHRSNLKVLREETETAIVNLQSDYEDLDPDQSAGDVGAGEDEGGSESDLTRFERDRIRAKLAEERQLLEVIDAAAERTEHKDWKNCLKCGNPIGDARMEALPAAELCVTCKADRGTW